MPKQTLKVMVTKTIGYTFEQALAGDNSCWVWFGRTKDIMLETTDNFMWHVWVHEKDGAVVEHHEGTMKEVLVRKVESYFVS